jgi:hypothetical protein
MPHETRHMLQVWCDHFILQENQGKKCTGTLYSGDHTGGQGPPGGLAYICMYKYTDQYFQLLTTRGTQPLTHGIAAYIVTYLSHVCYIDQLNATTCTIRG